MGLFSSLLNRVFGRQAKPTAIPSVSPVAAQRAQSNVSAKLRDDAPASEEAIAYDKLPEEFKYQDWTPVSSSLVAALRFSPAIPMAQALFVNGKIYTFGGMTFTGFKMWLQSGSKGQYFNRHLKGKYTEFQYSPTLGRGIMANALRQAGFTPKEAEDMYRIAQSKGDQAVRDAKYGA